MKINSPTIGPIVGYTTPNESRIWFRGKFEQTGESSYRRCFGLLRYRKKGEKNWSRALINKMSANFDMTCVLAPINLTPNSVYEYQAGWIFVDSELDALPAADNTLFVWPPEIYTFMSASADTAASRTYVVGSCRYLLKTFIGNIFDDRGDKIFKSITRLHDKNPINGVVMMGDQIYADDLNFLSPDTKLPEFLLRYRTVFSQDHIREMMAKIPTYMILDDHEIEDNWPANATSKDRITLYPHAIHAYQIYQCSHSPLFFADKLGRIEGSLKKFWYTFTDGCTDWFVIDSRTERSMAENNQQMINNTQLDALLAWIKSPSVHIKMIVTSVPFAPDMVSESKDKWGVFPAQRELILRTIEESNNKIVFISGDVHCSFTAEIYRDKEIIAHQIVSSSFFWPYPHAKKGDFEDNKLLSNGANTSEYGARIKSKVFSDDNFAKLDISVDKIVCTFYERKGGKLGSATCSFS